MSLSELHVEPHAVPRVAPNVAGLKALVRHVQ